MTSKNDPRFSSGPSVIYDRPDRRRTPSPGPAPPYPPYERYITPRQAPPFRESYPNSYRSDDAWRPNYPDMPSPDRFRPPSRYPESDQWGRPSWRAGGPSTWNDRRAVQEPYDNGWGRVPRDTMAQPMFEPSDQWKQSHGVVSDPPDISLPRQDEGWRYDRYPEEFVPARSPERLPTRDAYSPTYPPNDRYRRLPGPLNVRDAPPFGSRSDSYRQPYEERSQWPSSAYHPTSPYAPPDFSPRERPLRRDARSGSRPEFGERVRFSRERSVSGSSVRNSPLPSPIRTRTNLPDRISFGGSRPASYSGSYPSSPTKHQYRHSWDYDAPSYSRCSRSRSRSNSRSGSPDTAYNNDPQARRSGRNGAPGDRSVNSQYDPVARPHYNRSSSIASSRSSDRTQEVELPDASKAEPEARGAEDAATVVPGRDSEPTLDASQPSNGPQISLKKEALVIDTSVAHAQLVSDRHPPLAATNGLATNASRTSVSAVAGETPPASAVHDRASQETEVPFPPHEVINPTPASVPQTPAQEYSEPPSRGDSHPQPTLPAATPEQVGESMPLRDALRVVVALRLERDMQTTAERVDPILLDNLSKAEPVTPTVASPETIIASITSGSHRRMLDTKFEDVKPSLEVRFAHRQADLKEKVTRLREEYLTLHNQWLQHCAKLDDVAKTAALQEAAATAGRTTRRSLATMGDAVRSDLEMEQIIASLGIEELTDATHLGERNAAVIPDMITVTKGEIDYLYDDTNNEVDNPAVYYAPKLGFDDWTDEEIHTFIEKYGEHPKQFGIIADSLPNKTAAQCVSFYYLHKHKHFDFRQVLARRATKRKRGSRKQKGNALLADIIRRDEEVSVAAAPTRRRRGEASNTEPRRQSGRRGAASAQLELTPNGTPTPEPDAEPRKRRRRVTARAAAMELDDMEEEPESKKRGRKSRKSGTASVTPASTPTVPTVDSLMDDLAFTSKFPDQVVATMQRRPSSNSAAWSEADKSTFLELLAQHGDDFKRIAASMPNKTTAQVSAFYKANAAALGLEKVVANAPRRSPTPVARQDAWQHAAYAASTPIFSDVPTQISTDALQTKFSARMDGDMRSFSASGDALGSTLIPSSQSGIVRFRSTTYESMQAQYQAAEHSRSQNPFVTRAYPPGSEPMASLTPMPGDQIMNPSPFAPGAPLMTRFPNYAYNNFTPSHFTEATAARQSPVQPYAPSVRVRAVEPMDVTIPAAR